MKSTPVDIDMSIQPTGQYAHHETEPDPLETQEYITKKFDDQFSEIINDKFLESFLSASALHGGKSILEVKSEALSKVAEFKKGFQNWVDKQNKRISDFRSEWINLRKAGYSSFVFKNIERFQQATPKLQEAARSKWQEFYPDPWPLDDKKEAVPETPPVGRDEVFSENEGGNKGNVEKNQPENSSVADDVNSNNSDTKFSAKLTNFDALTRSNDWQEMSALQELYPKIYTNVTDGKMPATEAQVSAVIDDMQKQIKALDGIPNA